MPTAGRSSAGSGRRRPCGVPGCQCRRARGRWCYRRYLHCQCHVPGCPQAKEGRRRAHLLSFAWDTDAESEAEHTYTVQISTDDGRTWQTLAVGLVTPEITIDRNQFDEVESVLVRVIANRWFQKLGNNERAVGNIRSILRARIKLSPLSPSCISPTSGPAPPRPRHFPQ
ncbi:MAG: hypothetical protein K0S68_557 [Candidatus Saccharibacteria bacterium]|jgi:hypothetical protein|nr:hypothetical protein [Candidatus Saccharibacteria bacterium]